MSVNLTDRSDRSAYNETSSITNNNSPRSNNQKAKTSSKLKESSSDESDDSDDDDDNHKLEDAFGKSLKAIKSTRYPDYVLQRYLNNLSLKQRPIDFDLIDQILEHDISIYYQNEYGDTALHEACKLTHDMNETLVLVKILIEKGANKYAKNKYGVTCVHIAASYDNPELIKYLLNQNETSDSKINLIEDLTFEENQTALHYAAKNGCIRSAKCLIEQFNAKPEQKDYQGRTCLYLAAEYGHGPTVKLLIDLGCNINVSNIYGQKALYWIVAKCHDIAYQVLDGYCKVNKYTRKKFYYLSHIDLEAPGEKNSITHFYAKNSILMNIVENQSLDLIIHPVIMALIEVKWKQFGRFRAYFELILTLLNIIALHLLGTLVPTEQKHIYNFPKDWWRVFLSILCISGYILLILNELIELRSTSVYEEKITKQRLKELSEEKRFCHPHDLSQKTYLFDEQQVCIKKSVISAYFSDPWNWYEMLLIVLLIIVIITHIADVIDHNESIARAHERIFSITIIVVSLRIFEVGRFVNEKFGMLVIVLTKLFKNIFVWLCIYGILWISYSSGLWILFGGPKLAEEDSKMREYCISNPSSSNCTFVQVKNFKQFNNIMYFLWTATFARQYNRAIMKLVDPIMTDIFIGIFTGLFSLLLVYTFIALMSSTFGRVARSARAHFLCERAYKIIRIEFEFFKKDKHNKYLAGLLVKYEESKRIEETYDFYDNLSCVLENKQKEIETLNQRLTDLIKSWDEIFNNFLPNKLNNKNQLVLESEQDEINEVQDQINLIKNLMVKKLKKN